MSNEKTRMDRLFQAHPWHGVSPGDKAPAAVNAYIEIVPTDAVKYELDKTSGHLRVDRPQRFSSMCPTLYGFIPQTYCGDHVAQLCAERTGITGIKGDGDPMDICVLTEKTTSASQYGAAEFISRRLLYYIAFGILFGLIYQGPRQFLGYTALRNDAGGAAHSLPTQLGISFLWGYAFIHYYLDSKIWRVRRDPSVGKALNMS